MYTPTMKIHPKVRLLPVGVLLLLGLLGLASPTLAYGGKPASPVASTKGAKGLAHGGNPSPPDASTKGAKGGTSSPKGAKPKPDSPTPKPNGSPTPKPNPVVAENPFPNDYIYVGHTQDTSDFMTFNGLPIASLAIPVHREETENEGWSDFEGKYFHPDYPLLSLTYGKCGDARDILTGLCVVGPKSSYYKTGYDEVDLSPIDGYDPEDLGMLCVSYCDYESHPSKFAASIASTQEYPLTLSGAEEAGYVEGGCQGSMGGSHYWNGALVTPQDWNENDTPVAVIYDKYGREKLNTLRIVFADFLSNFGQKYPNAAATNFTAVVIPNYGEAFDNFGLGVLGNTACAFSYCNQTACQANIDKIQETTTEGFTAMHIMFFDPNDVDQWAECQIEQPDTCNDDYFSCTCELTSTCCGEDGLTPGVFPGFYFPPQ